MSEFQKPTVLDVYLTELDKKPLNEKEAARLIGLDENSNLLNSWRRCRLIFPMHDQSSRGVFYNAKLIKRAFAIMKLFESGLKHQDVRQALVGITRVDVEVNKHLRSFTECIENYFGKSSKIDS